MQQKNAKPLKPILSILLPVRNEGININLMLRILSAILEVPHETLVVYDSKFDKTIPEVNKLKKIYPNLKGIQNKHGKGVINAIKAGVQNAEGKYILLLAVDDVGPALAIEDMIVLMDKGCELVSCTRYKYGGRRLGGSLIEAVLSKAANRLFCFLCGSSLSDATTGFKMFKKDLLDKVSLESKPIGWAVVLELTVKTQLLGLKIGEVPIISIDRLYGGKSSFEIGPWMQEYLRWFFYGFKRFPSLRSNRKVLVRIPTTTTN